MTTLNGEKFWPKTLEPLIKPPAFKKMLGRPKINRKKEEFEIGSNGRLIKRGRQMTCQYYFGKRYNKSAYAIGKTMERSQLQSRGQRPDKLQVLYTLMLIFNLLPLRCI